MRFSLKWLFGAIAFAAIGCLSLIYASPAISASLARSLWLLLIASTVGAVFGCGTDRAFCGGIAIAGLIYMAASYLPSDMIPSPAAILDVALDHLYSALEHEVELDEDAWRDNPEVLEERDHWGPTGAQIITRPREKPFRLAGRVLAGILLSLTGGALAKWLHNRGA